MRFSETGGTMPLSGAQHHLRAGDYEAEIASVGASLRALTWRGRNLIVPFGPDQVRPDFRGAVLAPWPNRVVDGLYRWRGEPRRLPLSEPDRGHALHGLALWLDFARRSGDSTSVALAARIEPQTGYPHRIALEVAYELDAERGLTWSVSADNQGPTPAPYGCGPHPYLVAGPAPLDEWTLELPASTFAQVDGPRLLPGPVVEVTGRDFDFRAGRRLGAIEIDHAFGGVEWRTGPDGQPRATARVNDPSGSGVAISWDSACPWVQVHTADRPLPAENRLGLAVEPMTCPPDAFNSAEDLVVLEPGQTHRAQWTVSAW